MAAFQSRDIGRRGRIGDVRQQMNSQQMVLDSTWLPSSKTNCFLDEPRTQVAATNQFLDEIGTGNNQFFSHQKTTSRQPPFLSFDGNNSPQDEQFAPPPGFKRAKAGFNRIEAVGAHPRAHPLTSQATPQWTGGPQPAHLLSEEKRRALKALEGPPPGMPAHLIRPEERTNLVSRETQQAVPAANRRRTTASQYRPVPSSQPAVPKRQTKSQIHQLVQPAGITKPRPGMSAATSSAANTVQYGFAAPRAGPAASKGYRPNGQRRLPPLKLSQHQYRLLTAYAQTHNGRIPFRQGMGLPAYGKLRCVAPGRLELGIDHGSASQMGHAGPAAANRAGYMQSNNTSNNGFRTAQSVYTTPQSYGNQQQYGQNVSMPAINPSRSFPNVHTTGGNTGSNEPTAPTMLDDSNFDEAIQAALKALNEEAWKKASSSNTMPATQLNNSPPFTPQQTGMQNWAANSGTDISNDPIAQQAFQYQSQPTTQQHPLDFAAQSNGFTSPSLSHTGYNTSSHPSSSTQHASIPTTPLFPAPYLPRPNEHQLHRQRNHRSKPVTRASCPTVPPPASHFQQGPSFQPHQQQQVTTPQSSQNTDIFSPIPQPFPFPSSQSSTNTTPLNPHLDDPEGEPVHAYPNGPIVGRLIHGAFWQLGADGTLIPPAENVNVGDTATGAAEQHGDNAGAEEVVFADEVAGGAAVFDGAFAATEGGVNGSGNAAVDADLAALLARHDRELEEEMLRGPEAMSLDTATPDPNTAGDSAAAAAPSP